MPLAWVAAVLMLSVLRQSNGDSVTQTKGSVLISRGESVVVNCTYEAVSPSLFWYVQFPNQPPRLFLKDLGREDSDEGITKGFNATHDKKHKSFHLWKPSSELSDSATYYCAARDTVTRSSRGVGQKPPRGCGRNRRLLGATPGGGRRNSVAQESLCSNKFVSL
ncbi:T cell receptor alpha variable 18 [Chelonia mydas]|uniref:T cell receptor alpha variable 18 n=1 Tax=Chelonia mydas TaxID=8469 RepID=UPI001CA8CA1F|nr:T cell receptor alpha variable 18 [Chelonia mydas]